MKHGRFTADAPPAEPMARRVCAQLMNRLQVEASPASDEARLLRIRNAIARGHFHVNAGQLADRLIAELLQG